MTYTGKVTVGGPPDLRDLPGLSVAKLAVGPMDNNAYLLTCTVTGTAVLIDAASEAGRLIELIGSTPVTRIVTTHRHWDHWQALAEVQAATGATGLGAPRPRASARCSQPFQGRSDPSHRLRFGFRPARGTGPPQRHGERGDVRSWHAHAQGAVLRRRVLRPGRFRGSGPGTCTGHRDRAPLQLKARGLVPRVSLVCLRWRGLADRRPG